MKKIVIACDSYKGCLSSSEVARAAAEGVAEVYPDCEIVRLAVADGGEGTVDALVDTLGGHLEWAEVSDPLGRPVKAVYGVAGDLAIIESAAACGLTLLTKEERNPLITTTKGLGELILAAIDKGCRRFLIGLGGSATNDGGMGMISADGFLERARGLSFTVACDVDTPYIGKNGASRVFGPQKGASEEDVEDMILDQIDFDEVIEGADLVITGEGCSDYQTLKGKTAAGVLERARRMGIPVALVSGAIRDEQMLLKGGFHIIEAVSPQGMSLAEAMRPETAKHNIYETVKRLLLNE